jgi:iron complex transport system substrate-binding protein
MSKAVPYCLLILIVLTVSCSGKKDPPSERTLQNGDGIVKIAQRFTLLKTDSCTILTITDPWQGAEGVSQVFYLVKKDSEYRFRGNSSPVIYVPVQKVICMSTTHLAMIAALGMDSTVAGVSGAGYIYDQGLSEKIKTGIIKDVGFEAGLNNEVIIKCNPDLLVMYGIGSESSGYVSKIRELGFTVMFDADYLETAPLGKAEWIKVFGALFCREEIADSIFTSICSSYDQLKELIEKNTPTKPGIILGMPYRDTWFVSPGNSYISMLIKDAGGSYLWQDTESSYSLPYNLESVYLRALKADYWINIGYVNSSREIASFDPRLTNIPAFSEGHLFNNNNRLSPGGGNDYWESGTMNPHIILKDLASIFHPGIFGDYKLYYYRKIE